MESIGSVMDGIVQRSLQNKAPGDYVGDDGFLYCGNCHTQKQIEITVGGKPVRVGVMCECRAAAARAEEAERKRKDFESKMEALRRDGITDPAYSAHTFAQDDRRNPKISDVCLKYVQNWADMKADNIGILFYGDVGTGKSFLACAIANALLGQLVSVCVTNFPRILNGLQGSVDDRQKRIDRLQRYSLLVIDDLGVERDTSYSVEQVYNVIDTRARAGKPLIVTTNLSMEDLMNPPSLSYKRIYDRVLEMCPIRLKMAGESRRTQIADDRRDKARRIMGFVEGK